VIKQIKLKINFKNCPFILIRKSHYNSSTKKLKKSNKKQPKDKENLHSKVDKCHELWKTVKKFDVLSISFVFYCFTRLKKFSKVLFFTLNFVFYSITSSTGWKLFCCNFYSSVCRYSDLTLFSTSTNSAHCWINLFSQSFGSFAIANNVQKLVCVFPLMNHEAT
jgi:hypothetical protein